MANKANEPVAAKPEVVADLQEALEALLDLFLDGRMADLDEKEKWVCEMANAALARADGGTA